MDGNYARIDVLGRLLALILFITARSESTFVPVLLWESSVLSKNDDLVPALSFMTTGEFSSHLVAKIGTMKPLVIQFVQPSLSVEDFSLHSSAHSQLEKLTSAASRIEFIPQVENPVASIQDLITSREYSHVVYNEANISVKAATIIEVELSDGLGSVDRTALLQRHSATISRIYKSLASFSKSTLAIYTGRTNPWVHRVRRRAAGDRPIEYKVKDMRIEMVSDPVLDIDGNKTVLKSPIEIKEGTESGFPLVIVTYTIAGEKIVLRFRFSNEDKNWRIDQVEIEKGSFKTILKPLNDPKWTHLGDPFTPPGQYVFQNEKNKLIFESFRAEKGGESKQPAAGSRKQPAAGTGGGKPPGSGSGRPLEKVEETVEGDGTVFFTPTIWMGIMVVSILGLILAWGVTMLLDIKTMDRFDDPKAKAMAFNTMD